MYLPGTPVPMPGGVGPLDVYTGVIPPRNSRNAPTPEEMQASRVYLSDWGAAIARAEAAPVLASDISKGAGPSVVSYSGGSSVALDRSQSFAALGGGGYTADQLQEIADAPVILDKGAYQTPTCSRADALPKTCPPVVSNPAWGNSGVAYPLPKPCAAPVTMWISANPWLFVGLVVAGGFALSFLMDDK